MYIEKIYICIASVCDFYIIIPRDLRNLKTPEEITKLKTSASYVPFGPCATCATSAIG